MAKHSGQFKRKHNPAMVELFLTVKMPDGQVLQFQASVAAFPLECVPVTPEIRQSLVHPWASLAMEVSEAVTHQRHNSSLN